MKLKKKQIEKISILILKRLLSRKLIMPRTSKNEIAKRIYEIILEDMIIEDRLEDEVREILEKHSAEMRRSEADYQKTFMMIKQKLAKERNIVL